VLAVSKSSIAPSDFPSGESQMLVAAAQVNEPMYRITVQLPSQTVNIYGNPTRLNVGMSLDADIRQDSRTIWEWVLDPAIAVARKRI
jgi:membrane fusion protein